jgi:hypothetical protein
MKIVKKYHQKKYYLKNIILMLMVKGAVHKREQPNSGFRV